jgi:precorrin-6x reductase
MPTHQRFRLDNRQDLLDRRKPTIELDEEPSIIVRKLSAPPHLASQDDQLMPEHRILRLKPLFDLNGEASTARTKQISRIIAPI